VRGRGAGDRSPMVSCAGFHPDKTVGDFGKLTVERAPRAGPDGGREGAYPAPEVFVEEALSEIRLQRTVSSPMR